MKPDVKHPLPFYRKLLLENKILFFFAFLVALLGAVGLSVQYWATSRGARNLVLDHLTQNLDPIIESLGEAAAAAEGGQIDVLLERAVARDNRIAYLIVADTEGRPLEVAARTPAASSIPTPPDPATDAVSAVEEPVQQDFIEREFPLKANGRVVGTLTAGVERRRVDQFATVIVTSTAVVMLGPVLLLLFVARIVARRAVKGLKDLIRVADEISTGNLNPRIGIGLRVNCWEIKNCGKTDCEAYMNLSQQCWYIDGTPCEGFESRFPQKLEGCRECEVYQLHRGDEIVQLADAFRHMTMVLKTSRDRLVSSDRFQQQLIHNSFDGIVATDASDVITIFNSVAEDLVGISSEQVLGKMDWRAFFEDGLENSMDLPLSHERFHRARGFAGRETKILREDKKLVDVLLSGISLFEEGRHIGKVFFFQDMREVMGLREDLIRSERLTATGQAAAGISHSIKNILDGFSGGAYVFKQGRRNENRGKMDLGWDMIERNMQIISDLVKDLLNFAQERDPQYVSVDPAALIEDVLVNVGLKKHDRVKVLVQVEEPPPRVMLDPYAFHQCLTNLVRNAAEAIPGDRKGKVAIRVEIDGERAVFSVSDDGTGMDPNTIEKIKGGMYSTKGSKGTGLGLLVVQKIVSEHKGTLTIESVKGEGSTFRIEIPAAGASVAA